MKKIITLMSLLTFVLIGLTSNAEIDTNRLFSEDYLRNTNYSPEMVRMINLSRVDPYAPHIEEEPSNSPVGLLKRAYEYFNPAADNGKFGKGVINPSIDVPSGL